MAMRAGGADSELHRLVAHFVAARWPITIALNKVDRAGAAAHVTRCRERHPLRPMVPVSAASEVALLAARSTGACRYELGGGAVELTVGADAPDAVLARALRTLEAWGTTGCLEAISAAVGQRPPTIVFPVDSTVTLAPLAGPASHADDGTAVRLHTALLLKPLSTVADVFEVCKRRSPPLLAGDFVRAEARAAEGWEPPAGASAAEAAPAARPTPVRKEEAISRANAILRIQCNRKSHWQHQQHQRASAPARPA